jgi:hypothetical protein
MVHLKNRAGSSGNVTITIRTASPDAALPGSYVLTAGEEVDLPVAGMGGAGYADIVRVVAAASTICDGFFHNLTAKV